MGSDRSDPQGLTPLQSPLALAILVSPCLRTTSSASMRSTVHPSIVSPSRKGTSGLREGDCTPAIALEDSQQRQRIRVRHPPRDGGRQRRCWRGAGLRRLDRPARPLEKGSTDYVMKLIEGQACERVSGPRLPRRRTHGREVHASDGALTVAHVAVPG